MGIFDIFGKKTGASSAQKRDGGPSKATHIIPSTSQQDEIMPIEKRIRGQHPSCDGLYPHEVLVLNYAPKFYDSNNSFQGFWWYKYGIKDVQKILSSLAKRGYISRGTIMDAISLEKLPAIKKELEKRNLKTSGKKADLILRLVENASEKELSSAFPKRPYALTKAGESLLKKYEWIPFIHSHGIEDLDIWNLTEMVRASPHTHYRDIIRKYLNKCASEYKRRGDYGLYRNSRFTMSEFMAAEGRSKDAFSFLCEVVAYDLSGMGNGFRMELLAISAKYFFPYEKSIVIMAPGIITRIEKFAQEFDWTDAELHRNIVSEIKRVKRQFSLFTADECADIVIAEIHKDKVKLDKIYTAVEKRFRKQCSIELSS